MKKLSRTYTWKDRPSNGSVARKIGGDPAGCAMKITLKFISLTVRKAFVHLVNDALENIREVPDAKLANYSSTNIWTIFRTGQIPV